MLTAIRLKNFQQHKDRKFDLNKVTVLVGPSRRGKTTVLRALGLVLLNRWHKGFVRHGQTNAEVEIELDGHTITRKKGKRENEYTLDGKRFVSFGQGRVPDRIEAIAKVGPDNIQRQLDALFWFSESGNKVSQKLNQIINLHDIDKSLAIAGQDVSSARTHLKATDDRLKEARKERKKLEWVVEALADFKTVERLESDHKSKSHRIDSLARSLKRLDLIRSRRDNARNAIVDASETIKTGERADKLARQFKNLQKTIGQIEKFDSMVGKETPDLSAVLELRQTGDQLVDKQYELSTYIEDIQNLEIKVCKLKENLVGTKRALKKLSAKASVCPTCRRPL